MTTTNSTEPFSDEMLAAFERATAPTNNAEILPPALYTDPGVFELERRAIFERDWLCLGRVEQIPNRGDFFTITLIGEPLIVVRDKDDAVRVLTAVCQHRGMVIAEGTGNCQSLRCPYHHWSYALDGRLLGAPAMERAVGFDKGDFALPSLPVEIWNGFVFTSFDSDPAPLGPSLRSLEELLANFRLDSVHFVAGDTYEGLPWNWKVMLENFNDGYHAHRLHESVNSYIRSEDSVFLDWDDADNHVTRINYATHRDPSFNPTERVLLPVFPGLTDDERDRVLFSLLPPTLGLAVTPDSITYFVVNPTSVDSIDITIGYCVDPASAELPDFEEKMERARTGVDDFNIQDIDADTKVQIGLSSRFAPHGRYSWQEETLQQFNRWLVRRYRSLLSGASAGS
jgi:phenylpropionate dioxygenase-like ring-hydroxylating dioxygenase large terminal subunit